MVQMTLRGASRTVRDLLDALLEAQTEAEVHACLHRADMLDDNLWRPYGNVQNNSGTFFNQQASSRGALVEKIVNGIDAVLTARAFEQGDLPNGSPPASMFEAAERYFDVRDGRLAEILPGERRAIASNAVQVVLSGRRKQERPTISVADQGEGQNPQDFQRHIPVAVRHEQDEDPFRPGEVQHGICRRGPVLRLRAQLPADRLKAASTGTRPERPVGVHGRAPPIPASGRASIAVRVSRPGRNGAHHRRGLSASLEEQRRKRLGREHGTLVRLYEYDIQERTAANVAFSRMLNRRLYRLPIPVQVIETRGTPNEEIVPGLATRLDEDTSSDVEHGFPVADRIRIDGVGWVRVSLIPFREDVNIRDWVTASESVIFTVNGQAHAFEPRDFFRRDGRSSTNYRYLAQSLLVEVDCSELQNIEHLFMGSRDRMRDGEKRRALLRALADHLRQHEGLRQLNHKRREAAIRHAVKSTTKTDKMFEKMIAASPELAALLSSGTIPVPVPPQPPPPPVSYEGQRFATFLRWAKGGPYREKRCNLESYCLLELETDAANDFLSRSVDPGILDVEPSGWSVSEKLWNGNLRIRLEPPPGARAGEKIPIQVTFMSDPPPEVPDVLQVEGSLVVDPPLPPPPPTPPPARPRVAPPDIHEVRRTHWLDHDFDERSVASVDRGESTTNVFINMDNVGLARYLRADASRTSELEEMYKLAVAPVAISMERAVADEEITSEQRDKALSAVGDVILPAVDFAAKVAEET